MNKNLSPYPEYKPAGIDWLGDVPSHWEILPGRASYKEKPQRKNVGLQETTVLSLSYGEIVIKPPESLHGLVPESFETYQIIEPRDIIVRPTDLQNDWNSLRFGLSRHHGIITSAYMCLTTSKEMTSEYGYLLCHAYDLKKVFYGLGSGLRQNLSWKDFKYLPCLVPPLAEQAAIVRYLDRADERIQRAISAKERLIELLTEQRQAVIHHAVTRGLDPNARLKDSGVEWLGKVPQHWKVRRLRSLADISTGNKDTIDRIKGGKYPFFVRSQTVENIDTWSFDGEAVLTAGDGVGVGRVFHYINGRFDYHQRVYKFSDFRNIQGRFFYQYLATMLPFEVRFGTAKSTVDSLRLPMLQNLPVAVAPIREQLAIIRHLDKATADIDSAIGNAERQICLLREYRTRLIADVVTGQVDVR